MLTSRGKAHTLHRTRQIDLFCACEQDITHLIKELLTVFKRQRQVCVDVGQTASEDYSTLCRKHGWYPSAALIRPPMLFPSHCQFFAIWSQALAMELGKDPLLVCLLKRTEAMRRQVPQLFTCFPWQMATSGLLGIVEIAPVFLAISNHSTAN